jgi:FtsH-binding integral membrane protein
MVLLIAFIISLLIFSPQKPEIMISILLLLSMIATGKLIYDKLEVMDKTVEKK